MKKIILLLLALSFIAPVLADEINLTPKNSFSGFNNNGIRSKYPQLQKTVSASDIIEEQNDKVISRKSVREMGLTSPVNTGSTPMTYDQFPKIIVFHGRPTPQQALNGFCGKCGFRYVKPTKWLEQYWIN